VVPEFVISRPCVLCCFGKDLRDTGLNYRNRIRESVVITLRYVYVTPMRAAFVTALLELGGVTQFRDKF